MYKILDKSNLSWNCINCGMPNFSTTFFNSTIPELSNTYSELEISNDSENESTDNIGGTTDHNCHNIPLFVSKCKLCYRIHRGI
jgi:hypothetical protein